MFKTFPVEYKLSRKENKDIDHDFMIIVNYFITTENLYFTEFL